MEAPNEVYDLRKGLRGFGALVTLFLSVLLASSLQAQETVGEGEHTGTLVSQGNQVLKIGPVKPGQKLQVVCSLHWLVEKGGRVDWSLEDAGGPKLRAASHTNPQTESLSLEWTSNSDPKPESYILRIRPTGGVPSGEPLAEYRLFIFLRDQNDGDSGTDAPESYEKALLLPTEDPGNYELGDCFVSGTADHYDIYVMELKPNHSLNFKVVPLQWKGAPKAKVSWEFLNKSYKPIKKGQTKPGQSVPFELKIFHPQVRSGSKPAIYYFLVKIEGDASLFYALHLEIKEGP